MCALTAKAVREMYCVGWNVKPYSLTHWLTLAWVFGSVLHIAKFERMTLLADFLN